MAWISSVFDPCFIRGSIFVSRGLDSPAGFAIRLPSANTLQQIIHLECDIHARDRTIVVTVMGE